MSDETRIGERLARRGERLAGAALKASQEERIRDEIARLAREEERGGTTIRSTSRVLRSIPVAAAAAIIAVASAALWMEHAEERSALDIKVAIVESAATVAGFRSLHELSLDQLPNLDRGSPSAEQPFEEILSSVQEEDEAAAHLLLEGPSRQLRADWYRLAFESPAACSALVLRVDLDGTVYREYPTASQGPADAESEWKRFGANELHFLPEPALSLKPGPGRDVLEYHPGFVRPRSVEEATILLALTPLTPSSADLEALDAFTGTAPPNTSMNERVEELRDWLESRGFQLYIEVVERP